MMVEYDHTATMEIQLALYVFHEAVSINIPKDKILASHNWKYFQTTKATWMKKWNLFWEG